MRIGKDYSKEEYMKVLDIKKNGGTLFLIERTDTNEFYYTMSAMNSSMSNSENFGKSHTCWSSEIVDVPFTAMYLTREDAEETNKVGFNDGTGCFTCGHGSNKLETIVTEHQFG